MATMRCARRHVHARGHRRQRCRQRVGLLGPVVQKTISLIQDQWKFRGQNYKDVDKDVMTDIIQTMKCFALESFNHLTKIHSRLNYNPGLVLITF